MNNCDGDHETKGEIRRLPISGGANALVCKACFERELIWRRDRNDSLSFTSRFSLPMWEELEVVQPPSK